MAPAGAVSGCRCSDSHAGQDDDAAVRRLAALDSASVPAAPLLVGEVDGELRAAMSLVDSAVIADPFRLTVALVELLRVRSAQLGAARAAEKRRARVSNTCSKRSSTWSRQPGPSTVSRRFEPVSPTGRLMSAVATGTGTA